MESKTSLEQQQDSIGDVVSSDHLDDRPETHEVPFALVLERAPKGTFHPELREPLARISHQSTKSRRDKRT